MSISTPRASKEYLKAQKRPMLNKIIKQHNIINVSRMNITDLRDLMYKKKVREHDPNFTQPTYELRAAQIQPKIKDLKKRLDEIDKKLKEQKNKTVKYVKKVVRKAKTIRGQKEQIKDQKELLKDAKEIEDMAEDVIETLVQEKNALEVILNNLLK
jgi:chromosome segregation ATPase